MDVARVNWKVKHFSCFICHPTEWWQCDFVYNKYLFPIDQAWMYKSTFFMGGGGGGAETFPSFSSQTAYGESVIVFSRCAAAAQASTSTSQNWYNNIVFNYVGAAAYTGWMLGGFKHTPPPPPIWLVEEMWAMRLWLLTFSPFFLCLIVCLSERSVMYGLVYPYPADGKLTQFIWWR